jgi:FkbM family methyltransferase
MRSPQLQQALSHERSLPFVEIDYAGKLLRFVIQNEKCFYFATSIATREPDTNSWLETIKSGEIFFDIGANNSVFSIVAAAVHGAHAYAFEPHFASYYVSQQNIYLNGLESSIRLFPLAISSRSGLGELYLSSATAGKSLNNFGKIRPSADPLWNAVKPQASVTMTLNDICRSLGVVPNFLKIDVDGIEAEIIEGASDVLKNPCVRELMIEFNDTSEADVKAAKNLMALGFVLTHKGPSGYFFRRS